MKIERMAWARTKDEPVSIRDAVYDSLVDADHYADPGRTALNNAAAIAVLVERLALNGDLEVEDVAAILSGGYFIT